MLLCDLLRTLMGVDVWCVFGSTPFPYISMRREAFKLAAEYGASFALVYLTVDLQTALHRDQGKRVTLQLLAHILRNDGTDILTYMIHRSTCQESCRWS